MKMVRKKGNQTRDLPDVKRTLVGFVLDETGSMDCVRDSTISGFNEYIDSLRKNGDAISLTLVKFNSEKMDTLYNDVPISKATHLDDDTYIPDAMTPLYDAIAKTIKLVDKKRKAALTICDTCSERFACYTHQNNGKDCEKRPSVLLVIMTDGLENASKQYNRDKILSLIKKKEGEGWTFAYLGANQDAWQVGQSIGVAGGSTITYDASTSKGVYSAFRGLAGSTVAYVNNGSAYTANFFDTKEPSANTQEPDFDTNDLWDNKNKNARKKNV